MSSTLELPYGRRPRRHPYRWVGVALALCVGMGWWTTPKWSPHLSQFQYVLTQRRALSHRLSPDTVVFESDATRAEILLKQPGYAPPARAAKTTMACYRPHYFSTLVPSFSTDSVAFSHERRLKDGTRRLVIVTASVYPTPQTTMVVIGGLPFDLASSTPGSRVVKTGTSLEESVWVDIGKSHLQIFSGQPDAENPSHFTIRYRLGDQEKILDGWLREVDDDLKFGTANEKVIVRTREGR